MSEKCDKSHLVAANVIAEVRPLNIRYILLDLYMPLNIRVKKKKSYKIITLETDSSYTNHSFGNVKTIKTVGSF